DSDTLFRHPKAWPWDPRVCFEWTAVADRNSWMARPSLAMTTKGTVALAVRLRAQPCDVPHLPPGPDLGLAVDVQLGAGLGHDLAPVAHLVADQVLHHRVGVPLGGAQGEAAHRAHELLELAGAAGIDGPVP